MLGEKHPFYQFKFCPKCGSNTFCEVNEKAKKCNSCAFTYYSNSCAASVGVMFNEKGELLVATRAKEPAKGTYDLPGGFIDINETGEEAVVREIKEETNLDVANLEYLFSIPNIYVYSGFEVHTLDLVFKCTVENFDALQADDDVVKLEFIKIEDLKPDKFGLSSIKEVIKKIQKNRTT